MLALVPQIAVGEETWAEIWPEAKALGAAHAREVDEGIEPRRKWEPDTELLALLNLQGTFRILGARDSEGCLLGYITWTLSHDPESRGLFCALMGPWYASPEAYCGGKLFDASLPFLKALGVKCLYPHHRTQGRGAKLGPFFQLRGAKLIQHNYILWIGD